MHCHINFCISDDVANMGLRFRLYGCERMRRERMLGECVIGFSSLSLDAETKHVLTLEPRSNLSVSRTLHSSHGNFKHLS